MLRSLLLVILLTILSSRAFSQEVYYKLNAEYIHVNNDGFAGKKLDKKGNFMGYRLGFGDMLVFSFGYASASMGDQYLVNRENEVALYTFTLGIETPSDSRNFNTEIRPVGELTIGFFSGDRDIGGSYGSLNGGFEFVTPIARSFQFNVRAMLSFGMSYVTGGNVLDEAGLNLTSGPMLAAGIIGFF
ncbi:MAG: hypothetical protein IT279_10450 [Ignavibacteriaceae bacterium]|nr:hypothetical protein [Ignavibacteriaceae bacterium]